MLMQRTGRGWQLDWFGVWPWVPARYEGAQSLVVRADVSDAGVTVHMDASDGATLRLEVRVRPPVGVTINGLAFDRWSMSRELSFECRGDPFARTRRWAYEVLTTPLEGVPASSTASCATLNQLDNHVRALARLAAERCEPRVRAVARRFTPRDRLRVYGAIVADVSGRVAELASTSPGALLFALAIERRDRTTGQDAARRFLDEVVAGRKFKRALDEIVAAWAESTTALAWLSPEARQRVVNNQRSLVRRAGPRVRSVLLDSPPPLAFAPEDIPRSIGANAIWYGIVKSFRPLLAGSKVHGDSQHIALSRFVSANALTLQRMAPRDSGPSSAIEAIATWAITNAVTIARRSSVNALLTRCDEWLYETYTRERTAFARSFGEASLAPPPFADVSTETFGIRALMTAGDLCREADEMDNCVATLIDAALCGEMAIYSANVDGRRLTVAVAREDGAWRLGEIEARSNAPATDRERDVVLVWLEAEQRTSAPSG